MSESFSSLKARYALMKHCHEPSWDVRSFTSLQLKAFLDVLHRDCDEHECEADNVSDDWRQYPGRYGVKFKNGHTRAGVSTGTTSDGTAPAAPTLEELFKKFSQMQATIDRQQTELAAIHKKDKKRRRNRDCVEDIYTNSSEDEDPEVTPGSPEDFYEFGVNEIRK